VRILLARDVDAPEARIRERLADAGIDARVTPVGASLEDVFVAATRSPGDRPQ
jgi:hypothetical protein